MLKDLLNKKKCFKLVCGAGNEDSIEVEKLTAIYAKAGCKFFDLNASCEVVQAAKNGLKKVGVTDAFLCVSVGLKGDPHISKALIDYDKCVGCGQCDKICPQKAIKAHTINKLRCIGCGRCAKICPKKAISYVSTPKELQDILPPLIDMGIDCIELHAIGAKLDEIKRQWDYIKHNFNGMLSICTSRAELGDIELVELVKEMLVDTQSQQVIIQADGFPMSGGKDDFKTTLQAVATAEIIQNANLPVYIMLSGGTNSKTAELANLCGINYNGIAVGSFARKIVNEYLEHPEFSISTQSTQFKNACKTAEQLIKTLSL